MQTDHNNSTASRDTWLPVRSPVKYNSVSIFQNSRSLSLLIMNNRASLSEPHPAQRSDPKKVGGAAKAIRQCSSYVRCHAMLAQQVNIDVLSPSHLI